MVIAKATDEMRGGAAPAMEAARARLRRKNKLFGALLALIGAVIFVIVVTLVLLLHYAGLQIPQF